MNKGSRTAQNAANEIKKVANNINKQAEPLKRNIKNFGAWLTPSTANKIKNAIKAIRANDVKQIGGNMLHFNHFAGGMWLSLYKRKKRKSIFTHWFLYHSFAHITLHYGTPFFSK